MRDELLSKVKTLETPAKLASCSVEYQQLLNCVDSTHEQLLESWLTMLNSFSDHHGELFKLLKSLTPQGVQQMETYRQMAALNPTAQSRKLESSLRDFGREFKRMVATYREYV